MDFYTYTTTRDACNRAGMDEDPDSFYELALTDALASHSAQFFFQINNERDWEHARRPYYNVYPSIVPMLTRLNLDLDSALIQLPLPALCVRLPKQHNPLTFEWRGKPFDIRCFLVGDMDEGKGAAHQNPVGFSRLSRGGREKQGISASMRAVPKSWLCQMTLGSAC